MTRILFLFFPVFFGGLCLLIGETINWLKKRPTGKSLAQSTLLSHWNRK